jgi:chemotaxis protein CheC
MSDHYSKGDNPMAYRKFDQIRLDALKEISSIATGNAATNLSTILGRRVDITVPHIMVEDIRRVPEVLGGREKIVTVIYLSITGQFSGTILLVLSSSDSIRLANVLTGQKVDKIDSLDEMSESALKEVGNILAGSYVQVLAQGLKMRISYSIPGFVNDMFGAVLDEILARVSLEAEYAVIMESEFIVRDDVYRSHLILILSPDAVSTTIKALGSWKR